MELAAAQLFRAKWTDAIHDEWISAVLQRRPELEDALKRTRELMNAAVLDCLVTDYEDLIPSINCRDTKDRHIIAAAIRGHCSAIVTFNLTDFPETELSKYDIEAQHPDEFLNHQIGLDAPTFIAAAKRIRERLRNPPRSIEQYLDTLRQQQLPKTVNELARFRDLL